MVRVDIVSDRTRALLGASSHSGLEYYPIKRLWIRHGKLGGKLEVVIDVFRGTRDRFAGITGYT